MIPVQCSRARGLAVALCMLVLLPSTFAFADEQYWVYTARPGDTIWDLAERHTTSVMHWQRLQRINGLPDVPARGMLPGTRLKFPIDILKHQPASALVRLMHGSVQLVRADGSTLAASTGTSLHSGDRLVVGAGSNVTVQFADGSELLVLEDSDVVFDSLSAWGETGMVDTRIRLQSGSVDTQVNERTGPGSRYEIITPAAVAAVRGTDFRVSAERGQPVSRSEVLEGTVAVSGAGTARRVPAGFGVRAEAGAPPARPKPLLPAPDLSGQAAELDRLPLQFEWAGVDKAAGYRFQVATSAAFDSLLANATSTSTRGFLEDLPNGNYMLRVRAIDAGGLEGINALRPFRVTAHPRPPLLGGPGDGKLLREPRPAFGWLKPAAIGQYRYQLATDDGFAGIVADENLQQAGFTPESELVPGRYFWRVASIDADDHQGPWSDTAAFEYRAIPEQPGLEKPAVDEEVIELQWRSAGDGMHYQMQLDDAPGFTSPLLDETVSEPRYSMERPAANEYFVRVRAIDETGYAGPWSTAQSFTVPGNPWQLLIPAVMLLF